MDKPPAHVKSSYKKSVSVRLPRNIPAQNKSGHGNPYGTTVKSSKK
jgi:hypothetical protein